MATSLPKYETKTLKNGLEVVVIPMHNNTQVISTDIFYKVGSRNEIMGKTGIYPDKPPAFKRHHGIRAARLRSADLSRMAARAQRRTVASCRSFLRYSPPSFAMPARYPHFCRSLCCRRPAQFYRKQR